MKLMRVGAPGAEKPAILAADGTIRDLSAHVSDIGGAAIGPEGLKKIEAIDTASLPVVPAGTRIGPCVAGTGKFICIGLNYSDHAAETGATVPPEPIIFMKATSATMRISLPIGKPVSLSPASTIPTAPRPKSWRMSGV